MTAEQMDRKSRPLREAAQKWAREHGEGLSGGWCHCGCGRWRYTLPYVPINIEFLEDGSAALVWVDPKLPKCVAKTPRGLKMLLNKFYQAEQCSR